MAANRYRNYVRKSIFRYMFFIILLLFILVFAFLIINMKWFTGAEVRKNNAKITELLEREIASYKEGLNALVKDYQIINACKRQSDEKDVQANRLLYDFSNSREIRSVFALVDLRGNLISSNLYKDNQDIFLQSFLHKSLINHMLNQPEKIFMVPSRLNYSYNQTGDLMLSRSVMDRGEVIGFLFFDLLDEEIYQAVYRYNLDDVIITDQYNNLVFSVGRQSENFMGKYPAGSFQFEKNRAVTAEINGKHYLITRGSLSDSELYLYTLVSVNFQYSLFHYAVLFLIIAAIIMFIMLKPLAALIANKNSHAIDELRKAVINMGKGNMEYSLRLHVFEEFQELHDTFRQMVLQREELLKRNSELTERKRLMEIKQLEERINPHFVFNVLETLRYEVLIDANKASEMIMAFANIMRYSIYYGDTIVPLRTDIEYIKDYLMLQKMRYNRRLTYDIDIPEELMDCKIPKLVIQPVVENALKHGMKNVDSIHLDIAAFIDDDCLKLVVRDNGTGMEAELLDRLIEDLEREDLSRDHIGMYNSHRVIRLLYGPPYGLKIESVYGKGTTVTITLPADKGDGSA